MYAQKEKPKEKVNQMKLSNRAFLRTKKLIQPLGANNKVSNQPLQRVKIEADNTEISALTVEEFEEFLWDKINYDSLKIDNPDLKRMKEYRLSLKKLISDVGGNLRFRYILKNIVVKDKIGKKSVSSDTIREWLIKEIGTKYTSGKNEDSVENITNDILESQKKPPLEKIIEGVNKNPFLTEIISMPSFKFSYLELELDKAQMPPLLQLVYNWINLEVNEMLNVVRDSRIDDFKIAINRFYTIKDSIEKPDEFLMHASEVHSEIKKYSVKEFSLTQDRLTEGRSKNTTSMYGYHVTLFGYLPSISKHGLLTDRRGGSTRTNTGDQQDGSDLTSDKLNVYGEEPSSLRPYILQFEDARGMMQESPDFLRPSILRFLIPATIGAGSQGLDFMQGDAVNTSMDISPLFIEVLTSKGWMPVRTLIKNRVNPHVITPESIKIGQQKNNGIIIAGAILNQVAPELFKELTENLDSMTKVGVKAVSLRGKPLKLKGGIDAIFLGASLQTSASSIEKMKFAFETKDLVKSEGLYTGAADVFNKEKDWVKSVESTFMNPENYEY